MEEFEKIYRLYYLDIYKYLFSLSGNKDIAEELTQETFFSAMKYSSQEYLSFYSISSTQLQRVLFLAYIIPPPF